MNLETAALERAMATNIRPVSPENDEQRFSAGAATVW